MLKILSLAGGVAGAVTLSQAPEFSQQYMQRLAGQVDALTVVAVDFDRSALASGLGREEALQQMVGTAFLAARQVDMRRTFARHARLSENLLALRAAGPVERLAMPHRLADTETFAATWGDFAPAVPVTVAGALAGGAGFLAGWGILAAVLAGCAWPLRRVLRRVWQGRGDVARRDPPVLRPAPATVVSPGYRPLLGETR